LGPKGPFFSEPYGESKETFYSGLHLAHHASMPQTGIFAQVLEGSTPATEMPERFQVTLTRGGHSPWTLAYHTSKFEET